MVSFTLAVTNEFTIVSMLLRTQVISKSLIEALETHTIRVLLLIITNLRTAPNTNDLKFLFSAY